MTLSKASAARATLAAALGIAAGSAHAVPIVFEFTGTVTGTSIYTNTGTTMDDSLNGQSVSGRITVETEGLSAYSTSNDRGLSWSHSDTYGNSIDLITSELFIGGVSYDMGLYSGTGGYLLGFDSNGVPTCQGCAPAMDLLAVRDISTQQYWDVPPGKYYRREFGLSWIDAANPIGMVDLSNGFNPLEWLPLMNSLLPSGSYVEMTMDCADNECSVTRNARTSFSINSITASSVNVPEPGTLALFTLGLLGTGLSRRGLRR